VIVLDGATRLLGFGSSLLVVGLTGKNKLLLHLLAFLSQLLGNLMNAFEDLISSLEHQPPRMSANDVFLLRTSKASIDPLKSDLLCVFLLSCKLNQ
jgi:hypothetical protein